MAANQRNFEMFTYVDDNATNWNKRGELDTALNAIDGSAALTAGAPVWIDSARKHTRKAVFSDATTFRTKKVTIYTPTAFAALSGASTLNVPVEGETAAVVYTLIQKIGEKQPTARTTRKLADHA